MQKLNNSKIVRYPLAPAWRRIIAKVLDIVIIGVLVMSAGFALFCTDPNFHWDTKLEIAGWRYGVFVGIMALLFYGLMLLLPCLWGKTIGMKVFKLAYHKNSNSNFAFSLFKHELFIWEIVVILAFAMGMTMTFISQHQIDSLLEGASAIFTAKMPEGLDSVCYYVGTGFSGFYGVTILFLIAIIIATCVKNKKPAFHDRYSNILVIYKVKISEKIKPINQPILKQEETKAPGEISDDSLEEIDNI